MKYADAGVDIDAGNAFIKKIRLICEGTYDDNVAAGVGGFCSLYENPSIPNQLIAASTDGVGTKLLLAIKFRGMGYLSTIGIDLVAMSINDIITTGANPLFFLDYLAIPKVNGEIDLEEIMTGIGKGCLMANCCLLGGETAEMPAVYDKPDKMDMAGFAVGIVDRDRLLGLHRVEDGDAIIGIDSSGPHANGFSLIAKSKFIADTPEVEFISWCMTPTIIYNTVVRPLVDKYDTSIHAMAHITGGGLEENILRVIPHNWSIEIDWRAWTRHNGFNTIAHYQHIGEEEMSQVFNLGIGFVVIVDQKNQYEIIKTISEIGLGCRRIGNVKKTEKDKFHLIRDIRQWWNR